MCGDVNNKYRYHILCILKKFIFNLLTSNEYLVLENELMTMNPNFKGLKNKWIKKDLWALVYVLPCFDVGLNKFVFLP